MHIVVGISYYYPNISGLTIYAKNLAEDLVKRGHTVTVLTAHHDKALPREEVIEGVRVVRSWTPFILGRGPLMPFYFLDAIREIAKSDIVHFHIPSFEVVIATLVAKLFGKKVVLTHHCDLSDWKGIVNQITEKVAYIALLVSASLADKIVVYTKDYADHSDFLQQFKKKLIFSLPPVKVEKPTKKLVTKYKTIKYKIGFAGRIAHEKGIEYLLDTIPVLRQSLGVNFKIFLAGPTKEVIGGGNIDDLVQKCEKYKDNIEFLGPLGPQEMADFYAMLDVLVLPSTEKIESFGFVQVEAMLLGCPVIASDMPGVRMPTKLSLMGMTTPLKDARALAKNIIEITTHKKKFVKSKKTIEKIFSYKDVISFYEKLFTKLFS